MRTLSVGIALFISGLMTLQAQVQMPATVANANQPGVPASTEYQATQQDGNSSVWQQTAYEQSPDGTVVSRIHQYTELATGLNHLVAGQWVASDETITLLPDGTAAAVNGQHQAYFPSDIYNGQIKLVTPDGKVLLSQPAALSYDDGSNTVLIAVLTNSVGQLVDPNQIVYPNAFSGINADLRYTYTKAGFEQDVVLRSQIPDAASLGLNPDTVQIQVMTEFFNPPPPIISVNQVQTMAGEIQNDQLTFGAMQMVQGQAFSMGTNSPSVPVNKQWTQLSGRQFLVEEVPIVAMANELEALPAPVNQTKIASPFRVASGHLTLPAQHLASRVPVSHNQPIQLAKAVLPKQGLVLDYKTVNSSLTNFTFQGDLTYYISGNLNLLGTNIIEGGAVLKYTNNASINFNNAYSGQPSLLTQTGPYRMAVLTSMNDNSVGETISGSTGVPTVSGNYLENQLTAASSPATLSYLRFNYAGTGINQSSEGTTYTNVYTIRNCQFINCATAMADTTYDNLNTLTQPLYNVLFSHCGTAIINGAATYYHGNITVYGQNVTADQVTNFLSVWSGDTNAIQISRLVNSILTGVQNPIYFGDNGSSTYIPVNYCYTNSSGVGIYQTVGGGSYYLTNGSSLHNAGTTSIDPYLLNDLAIKTTYPPVVYTNASFSIATNFSPHAFRDNVGNPDLGYHYDPLDYIFGGCSLSTNMTLAPGTAVGWFEYAGSSSSSGQPYGLSLNSGANLTANGTVTAPCYIARFETVQEGNGNWSNRGWMGGFMLNGSGTTPQWNMNFTKLIDMAADAPLSRDNWDHGQGTFNNCEFYDGSCAIYDQSLLTFTNCLFNRIQLEFYDQDAAPNFTFQNCTFYDGYFTYARFSGQNSSMWIIKNTAFDGTVFTYADNFNGGTNNTAFDYNSYNTNNLSWQTYPGVSPPIYGTLEVVGTHDVKVGGYNWQSSWFGNFYLPTNSSLINVGSTTADQLGLYHFTTQTNQVPETNSIVDIGYHYVATDAYGNPLDSNGDGIPDYIEDANGNGIFDVGDLGNWNVVVNNIVPAAWYTANGLNPSNPLTGIQDADWDGLLNQQEYLYGSNPQISEGFNIWIATPSTTSIP